MALDFFSLGMAFSLGLLGSIHCLGMCGGIACLMSVRGGGGGDSVALVQESTLDRLQPLLMYNAGRVSSYAVIGLLVGLGSELLVGQWQMLGPVLRVVAGGLLILMGLYVAGLSRLITVLESAMAGAFGPGKLLAGNSAGTLPVFVYGLAWGWLPCGLVYSSVVWASTSSQSVAGAAVLMLFFGLGTLPAMLATGLFAEGLRRVLQLRAIRLAAGACIVLYGVWTLLGVLGHTGHEEHEGHHHHHAHSQHWAS